MKTVSDFFKSVNRQAFGEFTGFKQQAISRAIADNVMPSGWYMLTRKYCEENEIDVPDGLFRWSGIDVVPSKGAA